MPPATPPPAPTPLPAPGPAPATPAPAGGGAAPATASGITLGKVVGILAGATVALGMMSAASPQGPLYRGPASDSAREAHRYNDWAPGYEESKQYKYEVKTEASTTTITISSGNIERTYKMNDNTYEKFQRMVLNYQAREEVLISKEQLARAVVLLDADCDGTVTPQEVEKNLESVLDEVTDN